ncbi:hypothetical protein [Nostoc sp. WHI]|uniref:hypothetical protein n=1 Tax=Nostoc sp. WHI TaxID=2650611 RepID=UPI0018C55462|nr:hypothetical protein [Nostoc sp. WHI]MBG1267749.1 hypothetical protein [Nostoc sp. WHI]
MEIFLPGFNIDAAIDSQWKSANDKEIAIQTDRKTAEETAAAVLVKQFQNELNGCIESNAQASLNLKILPPKEISIFSVCAYFEFMNIGFYLRRHAQNYWEICYQDQIVPASADFLQKQLFSELGKVK